MSPVPLRGSCKIGKVYKHWEVPSFVGRSARREGELLSLRGDHNNRFAEGKVKRDLHNQYHLTLQA